MKGVLQSDVRCVTTLEKRVLFPGMKL